MQAIDFSGQVVLVTGAARGIGRATAQAFGAAGASLALADIQVDALEATAEALRGTGAVVGTIGVDVRDPSAGSRMVEEAVTRLGRLDVLVNNAGGTFEAPFLQVNPRGFEMMLALNLGSVWHATQAAARWWIEHEVPGRVVNVSSTEALKACPGYAAYAAAKAGVLSLTQTLAVELGPYGIRVNAIAPDYTRIETSAGGAPDEDAIAKRIPLGRYGEPSDHAGAALFLASPLSEWITGQTLVVDGGALVAARVEGAFPVKPQDASTRRRD